MEFVERTRADLIDMVNLKMDKMKEKFVTMSVQERNAVAGPQKKEAVQGGSGRYKNMSKNMNQMQGEGFWSMLGYEATEKKDQQSQNEREGGLIDLGTNTENTDNNMKGGKGKGKGGKGKGGKKMK